ARRGKGIEAAVIEHAEGPWQVGTLGLQRKPAAERVHITLERLVLNKRFGAEQRRRELPSHRDFLVLSGFLERFFSIAEHAADLGSIDALKVRQKVESGERGSTHCGERRRDGKTGQLTDAHAIPPRGGIFRRV